MDYSPSDREKDTIESGLSLKFDDLITNTDELVLKDVNKAIIELKKFFFWGTH